MPCSGAAPALADRHSATSAVAMAEIFLSILLSLPWGLVCVATRRILWFCRFVALALPLPHSHILDGAFKGCLLLAHE
jgi:hypothetical protein